MQIRIRLGRGVPIQQKEGKNRHLALATAGLLIPASMMACTLAFWRLAADMEWAAQFAISSGPFSHWVVWMATAALLALVAMKLNRYGRGA